MVGHDTAELGHDTAKDSACNMAERHCDTAGPSKRVSNARARAWLLGECRDTINCIVTGGRLGHWVVSQDRCNTAEGSATILLRELRYVQQCAQGARRHGRTCAATRPGQACDTAQCARKLGQGWVHCALDSVLTQCTVLSHCLGHCS